MKVLILSCNTAADIMRRHRRSQKQSVSMVTVQKCWIICLLPEMEYRTGRGWLCEGCKKAPAMFGVAYKTWKWW